MRPYLKPHAFRCKFGVTSGQGVEALAEEYRAPGVVREVLAREYGRVTDLYDDSVDGRDDWNCGWCECHCLAEVPKLVQDGIHGRCVVRVRDDDGPTPPIVLLAYIFQCFDLFDVTPDNCAGVAV